MIKSPSILEKINVRHRKNAKCVSLRFQPMRFNQTIADFKFNFLSLGQLESLNLDKFFLSLFKILPC